MCLNAAYDKNGKKADFQGTHGSPAVGDVTGDGVVDVVTSVFSGYRANKGRLDGNGRWGLDKTYELPIDHQPAGAWYVHTPSLVDLDDDGVLDVLVGSGYRTDPEGDHPDGRIFAWRYDPATDSFERFCPLAPDQPDQCFQTPHPYWWIGASAVLDLDGDGALEIVFPQNDGWVFNPDGSVQSHGQGTHFPLDLDHDGQWSFAASSLRIWADLDADGQDESLYENHLVLSNGAEAPGWPLPTTGGGVWTGTVADLDSDERLEYVYSDGQYVQCVKLGEKSWDRKRVDWWEGGGHPEALNPVYRNGQYDATEPTNDSPSKAPILAGPTGALRAFVWRSGDVDYYRFPIFGYWTSYTFSVRDVPPGADYDLVVTNADGTYTSCTSTRTGAGVEESCFAYAYVPGQDFKGYFLVQVAGKGPNDRDPVRPYRLTWTKNAH